MHFTDYLIDELAHFHFYPPADRYEEGYFDGLAYMAIHFEVLPPAAPQAPTRPKLTLIQGGKS